MRRISLHGLPEPERLRVCAGVRTAAQRRAVGERAPPVLLRRGGRTRKPQGVHLTTCGVARDASSICCTGHTTMVIQYYYLR
jgi:hypothetical protein